MPAVPLKEVAVHLRPNDNIAVAAKPLAAGTEVLFNGGSSQAAHGRQDGS